MNLLREGLDLPEVTLVAILDADKEGFLRSETSLIQTVGRAARNAGGQVIMYADKITRSMQAAIDETDRRREIQRAHNEKFGLEPVTVKKEIRETVRNYDAVAETTAQYSDETNSRLMDKGQPVRIEEIPVLIGVLEKQMKELAKSMEFEKAAEIRDEISGLRKMMGVSDGRIGVEKRKLPSSRGKSRYQH